MEGGSLPVEVEEESPKTHKMDWVAVFWRVKDQDEGIGWVVPLSTTKETVLSYPLASGSFLAVFAILCLVHVML